MPPCFEPFKKIDTPDPNSCTFLDLDSRTLVYKKTTHHHTNCGKMEIPLTSERFGRSEQLSLVKRKEGTGEKIGQREKGIKKERRTQSPRERITSKKWAG